MPWNKGLKRPGGKVPGSGRKAGTPNKRTTEVGDVARAIVEDPAVQARWLEQAIAGTLPPPILITLMYYAWGKPAERVQHGGELGLAINIENRLRQANERIERLRRIGPDTPQSA